MKRPVHVVAMWSSALGREVETVWPGIAEVQTTAARTGQWAGMDPARFGREITRTFKGSTKINGNWKEIEAEVTFPEWCEVTVYRIVGGIRCPFTETTYWEEAYARMGKGEAPTSMWIKRPRGQLIKCAKAASLRAAFPEEASYTAEEMAGKPIDGELVATVTAVATPVVATPTAPTRARDPEATPEPEPEATPVAANEADIDAATLTQIKSLVTRATKSHAWASAHDYFITRFEGGVLQFALERLVQAERDAEPQAA
ncbi:recombinase RecT [uncultured Thiocystis sp.]|uniref:recombinase RecT n=1 Tax=uncultured Thiocystis sp. TaxID=1202134 RepID=UPI0034417014